MEVDGYMGCRIRIEGTWAFCKTQRSEWMRSYRPPWRIDRVVAFIYKLSGSVGAHFRSNGGISALITFSNFLLYP